MAHVLFVSYARCDNSVEPGAPGVGAVTALVHALAAAFHQRSRRTLDAFFDVQAIDEGRDWQRELGAGIRDVQLLLAVVSPAWLASPHCRWEWAQYLRREHAAARGDDGMVQAWLVPPGTLAAPASDDAHASAWADLHRRQHCVVLPLPWVDGAPPANAVGALADHLVRRLDAIALAEQAPGNLQRVSQHFVGRHAELRAIHEVMRQGARGAQVGGRTVIAAAHSPGGLGKTALARAYAHAHAGHFAAGGTWELPCEGVVHLGRALARLANDARLQAFAQRLGHPLNLTDAAKADDDQALVEVLARLQALTQAHAAALAGSLRPALGPAGDATDAVAAAPTIAPRLLLILDNVDQPALLSAQALAQLPASPWLELLVTTRLDPARSFAGAGWQVPVAIAPLPEADALALLQAYQPGGHFANTDDEAAACRIAQALDGYTLLVELVGAYLGSEAATGYGPRHYLQRLQAEGLAAADVLADHGPAAQQLIHREKRVGAVLAWSIAQLSAPAHTALVFASRLQPDEIPLHWLLLLTKHRHPEALAERDGYPSPWAQVWQELAGLSLMHPVAYRRKVDRQPPVPTTVRIHRVVAAHAESGDVSEFDADVERFLNDITTGFEQEAGQTEDAWLLAQYSWLRDQTNHVFQHRPSPTTARSLGVIVAYENMHGSLTRAIEMGEAVLAAQSGWLSKCADDSVLARDVSVRLVAVADLLSQRGHTGDADQAFVYLEQSLEIRESLWREKLHSGHAARDLSVGLQVLADFLNSRGQGGDAQRALNYAQRSVEIREKLLLTNPGSTKAARDVAVSLQCLGDLVAGRGQAGDDELGLGYIKRSLEIFEELMSTNPSSTEATRDVSASLEIMVDWLARRGQAGDLDQSLSYAEVMLKMREHLLRAHPNSARAARDLGLGLWRIADLLVKRGRPEELERGLELAARSLELLENLSQTNPASAQAARDMSQSLIQVAQLLAQRGQASDVDLAISHFQRGLALREDLLCANPGSAQTARDVSAILNDFAVLLAQRGKADDDNRAIELLKRDLQISEDLSRSNPESAPLARDVTVSLNNLANIFAQRGVVGDFDLAIGYYLRCLSMREVLLSANPSSTHAAHDVAVICERLAHLLTEHGGDAQTTLGISNRALTLHWQNLQSQPDSYAFLSDFARTAWQAALRANQLKAHDQVTQLLGLFAQVLTEWQYRGGDIEPWMQEALQRIQQPR